MAAWWQSNWTQDIHVLTQSTFQQVICQFYDITTWFGEHSEWTRRVNTASGHSKWTQQVNTASEHSKWTQRVDTASGHGEWTQRVDTASGHGEWTQRVDTASGHGEWTQQVNTVTQQQWNQRELNVDTNQPTDAHRHANPFQQNELWSLCRPLELEAEGTHPSSVPAHRSSPQTCL